MPNRILREGYRTSPRIQACSCEARDCWTRLVTVVDDHGRYHADPRLVASACYPLLPIASNCQQLLAELAECRLLDLFVVGGKVFLQLGEWHERRRSNPKFPSLSDGNLLSIFDYLDFCAQLTAIDSPPRARARSPSTSTSTSTSTLNPLSDSQAKSDVVSLPDQSGKPSRLKQEATEVLVFLNEKAGRHYRTTDNTLKPIMARLKEGYSVQECKAVIARKRREWAGKDDMAKYLRPVTLFGAEKFAQYIGEVPPPEAADAH